MTRITVSLIFLLTSSTMHCFAQSDNCESATPIILTNGQACVSGTTTGATPSSPMYGSCNVSPVNEVWYTYVASGSQNEFTLTPSGLTNAEIVIDIDGCSDSSYAYCASVTGSNLLMANLSIALGTQVWVMIASDGGVDGDFQLCINSASPVSGANLCSGAFLVCDTGLTYNIPNLGAWSSSGTVPR